MSLLKIRNKNIFYELFFCIPVKRRLEIISYSKVYHNKLEYLPITKNICNKISLYMNNKIDKNFEDYNYKEDRINTIYSDLFDDIFRDITIKFDKNISDNFQELIKELMFEELKSKNIYLVKKNTDNVKVDDYKILQRINYYNNIINFDNKFCKILTNELKSFIYNNKKIFGVIITINNIDINNLDLLNKIFNNIHYLELDFSDFFNDFKDSEIQPIFLCLDEFAIYNPIEILYFKDDTERTENFIEHFQKFTKKLKDLNKFYMEKYFANSESQSIIEEANKNDNQEILSKLEYPNCLLDDYLMNINKKIKILNLDVSNPLCFDDSKADCGIINDVGEFFSIISKFQNLEEFVLSYDVPEDCLGDYPGETIKLSLLEPLNSIKGLKNVIFKGNEYFLETLSEIKVENASFIDRFTDCSEISRYLISTDMLNNIKNIEIIGNGYGYECSYKNKILKYEIDEDKIKILFDCSCEDTPGFKNIEELFIKINIINKDYYNIKQNNNREEFENIILYCCKQNKHLKKININYLTYDLNVILNTLCNYCNDNDTIKNIELTGRSEKNNINMILDNIIAIKNQKVDIVANILDNDISTIISNNEHIKKGKLSYENISVAFPSNAFVKIIKIK